MEAVGPSVVWRRMVISAGASALAAGELPALNRGSWWRGAHRLVEVAAARSARRVARGAGAAAAAATTTLPLPPRRAAETGGAARWHWLTEAPAELSRPAVPHIQETRIVTSIAQVRRRCQPGATTDPPAARACSQRLVPLHCSAATDVLQACAWPPTRVALACARLPLSTQRAAAAAAESGRRRQGASVPAGGAGGRCCSTAGAASAAALPPNASGGEQQALASALCRENRPPAPPRARRAPLAAQAPAGRSARTESPPRTHARTRKPTKARAQHANRTHCTARRAWPARGQPLRGGRRADAARRAASRAGTTPRGVAAHATAIRSLRVRAPRAAGLHAPPRCYQPVAVASAASTRRRCEGVGRHRVWSSGGGADDGVCAGLCSRGAPHP